jgi:hypothetical protein
MELAVTSYEQKLEEANPLYATTTNDGQSLTMQEAAFIHHYIQLGNATQAFLKAGFTFPRRKRTKEERATGIDDITRPESYNELYRQNDLHHGAAEKRKEEVLTILNKEYNLLEEEIKQSMVNSIIEDEYSVLAEDFDDNKFLHQVQHSANHLLHMPAVQKELGARIKAIKCAQVADEQEVLAYFTAVMRGQVLDQFGLEAPLQERTRAAECLAKRIIDMPKKLQVSGTVGNEPVNLIIMERNEEEDIIEGDYREL